MAKAIKAPQNIDQLLTKITDKADAKKIQELLDEDRELNEILLEMAKIGKHPSTIKVLIDFGADINTQNLFEDYVVGMGNSGNLMINEDAGETPLILATRYNNNLEIMKILLRLGANVDAKDSTEHSAIMFAFYDNNVEKVKILVNHGATINMLWNDVWFYPKSKESAIFILNYLMKQFVKDNTNIDTKDINGDTLLIQASRYGDYDLVEQLLIDNANINIQNNAHGADALMIAVGHGYKDIVELLIKNGADISLRDNYGKTALDYAKETNNPEIIDLLSKYNRK